MKCLKIVFLIIIINFATCYGVNSKKQPNIVLILADDLGWNDVSFHGANQIPTPNIDALAYNGLVLNRFYTLPTCTPSRAALLTGQYPIRLGFQGMPIKAGENRHLPLDTPLLPQKLKELGYSTNLVGKWHLGSAYKNVTPTFRGFDYHFGYWYGYIGYFDHEAHGDEMHGLDMHENMHPMWTTQNEYVTSLLTRKAEEVIRTHNESKPLFLMMSHLAPHSGKSGIDLEVPDVNENNKKFGYIKDKNRRLYAGMVDELDKSVGRTVKALAEKGILDNTLILFFSDNGAQTIGLHENAGSNWPLRGLKFTVQEGGVRNVAVVYSSQLKHKGGITNELIHISDWMPTLYAAAGGNASRLGNIDGVNQWSTLMNNEKSKRTKVLLTIDETNNSSGLISENGRYKLINGSSVFEDYDNYYGESGRDSSSPFYNITAVLHSDVNIALGNHLFKDTIQLLQVQNDIGNCRELLTDYHSCKSGNFCLFDLWQDPCETRNVAKDHPDIVEKLEQELSEYWNQLHPQKNKFADPKANPLYYNNTWTTWLDNDSNNSVNRKQLNVLVLVLVFVFHILFQ